MTDPIPESEIRALLELAEKATPGPLEAIPPPRIGNHWKVGTRPKERNGCLFLVAMIDNGAPGDTLDTEEANARLFAAACNLTPRLCQELLEAREKVTNLTASLKTCHEACRVANARMTEDGKGGTDYWCSECEPRHERCDACGDMVAEWSDPEGGPGRVCKQCERYVYQEIKARRHGA